jgi:hypothetical protein
MNKHCYARFQGTQNIVFTLLQRNKDLRKKKLKVYFKIYSVTNRLKGYQQKISDIKCLVYKPHRTQAIRSEMSGQIPDRWQPYGNITYPLPTKMHLVFISLRILKVKHVNFILQRQNLNFLSLYKRYL